MNGSRALGVLLLATVVVAVAVLARVGSAQQPANEETISGTISTMRVIVQNARLTGDVTCMVNAAPCIQFGGPGLTLNLAGFTITGQADASTSCQGNFVGTATGIGNEDGIAAIAQADETIQGPGLVQRFRGDGIQFLNSARNLVTHVTASTNCLSGILVFNSSDNHIESNVSVRNGNTGFPCGGI